MGSLEMIRANNEAEVRLRHKRRIDAAKDEVVRVARELKGASMTIRAVLYGELHNAVIELEEAEASNAE